MAILIRSHVSFVTPMLDLKLVGGSRPCWQGAPAESPALGGTLQRTGLRGTLPVAPLGGCPRGLAVLEAQLTLPVAP